MRPERKAAREAVGKIKTREDLRNYLDLLNLTDEERDGRMPRDPYKRMGFDGEPKERLEKVMDAMGEIWAAADPDVKAKMKTDVKDLLYQMEQAGA